ncbi:SDR family NAD(P)-dependent oxidoreductase [Acidovorax sp. LjRoot129]|uniref:SDR family NAD(P)-dependent oxidoreductase n=1 Tax=Acidovorax sp. LjRoot129 TaxID=3342260 RepID=UPI003ECCF3A1
MNTAARPLAIVTGASSGIGFNLARIAAEKGYDLIVAADQPLDEAVLDFQSLGATVRFVQVELATKEGVDTVLDLVEGCIVDVLIANAGHGLGGAFLDQDFVDVQHVINTNITGTIYLLREVGHMMRLQGRGRILVTGSVAGFQPGAFQAVYNGTKAFIDSFVAALRNELKDEQGISITCLMPGATDTEFFARADMLDTKVGSDKSAQMDPAEVAKIGFQAMLDGEADVIAGWKNKAMVALAKVLPSQVVAEQHRKLAEPGSAKKQSA